MTSFHTDATHLVILPRATRARWLKEHHARQTLIRNGHSAFKAQSILLDCKRGNRYALNWLLFFLTSDQSRLAGGGSTR